MAFQPRFEHPYGFALLDELHNFFPEILYDNEIFNHLPIQWMRDRVQTLFPQAYARQTHMYGIYGRTVRQREFSDWISHHNGQPQPSLPPPVATREQQSQETSRSLGVGPVTTGPSVGGPSVAGPSTAGPSTAGPSTAGPNIVEQATTVIPDAIIPPIPLPSSPAVSSTSPDPPPHIIRGSNQNLLQNLLRGLTAVRSGEIRSTITTSTSAEPSAEASRASTPPGEDIILQSLQTPPRITYQVRTNQNPIRNYRLPVAPAFPSVNLLHSLMTLGLGLDEDVGGQMLWPDVTVHPTQEQVEAGSELIPPTEMASEVTCAICMEHDRRGEFNTTWRRLDCHHDFHQPCIDQWYTTSVHCPVCRHDIREPI